MGHVNGNTSGISRNVSNKNRKEDVDERWNNKKWPPVELIYDKNKNATEYNMSSKSIRYKSKMKGTKNDFRDRSSIEYRLVAPGPTSLSKT